MFWIIFAGILLFLASLPFLRLIFKRILMALKLSAAAKKAGGRLIPTHFFWLFGKRRGNTCDFYIETANKLISVKLFTMLRKQSDLHIFCQGSYYVQHSFSFWLWIGGTHETKPKQFPVYNFMYALPKGAEGKPLYPTLLVHPACLEIKKHIDINDTVTAYAGDLICGMYVQSLAGLTKICKGI